MIKKINSDFMNNEKGLEKSHVIQQQAVNNPFFKKICNKKSFKRIIFVI